MVSTQKLPKILEREPLIDALFEVRLQNTSSLAEILPGFLFNELGTKPKIQRLPSAEIPWPMRANDPNLQFVPVIRLEWDDFFISVGDTNFLINCKMPYPKWPRFKAIILDIVERVAKLGIAGNVQRYSLKYVNIISAPTLAEQLSKVKLAITLGPVNVKDEHVNLKVHRNEDGITHILTVVSGAKATAPVKKEVLGIVVDIDSIREVDISSYDDFADGLEPDLEQLRQANKMMFFGCLQEATIKELGPIYE